MGPSVMSPSMSPMGGMGGMGGMPPQMAPLGVDAGANGMSSMMQGSSFAGLAGGGGDYCDNCGPGGGGWTNRYFAWGEFLYLRPRNAEVAYAVPVDRLAAIAGTTVQTGNVHAAELDYQPAFGAGFGFLLSPRSAESSAQRARAARHQPE
jgi:hypothetical protein